jgi:hypothetical protein
MALDARFITGEELEELFRDKDTGLPLAFGTVEFFQDNNRTIPKLVYTLENAANPPTPPNYGYVPLPNPITLSAVGTISDVNGNNVPIYYFPFQGTPAVSDGTQQLYYIVISNAQGVVQFTREAWPNSATQLNPTQASSDISNALSNPQFVQVSISNPANPLIINFTGAGTTNVNIAPDWTLIIQYNNTGTVTVQRTPIPGSLGYPGNPPYTLTITPGANVTALTLRQRLNNNPDVFAPAVGGLNGYLSASILLSPNSNLQMFYQPNGQPQQLILTANNVGLTYAEFSNTVQLSPANNTYTGDTGYVDILLSLPIVGATTFSNVQIVGLNTNVQNVLFDQTTANRQIDQLFNYYNPLLQYKPIPSYLVGWDFPLNPAQFLGRNIAAQATGANTSYYAWDQTILFQSANSGITVSPYYDNSLILTANNTTQLAIIQYLEAPFCNEILLNNISVNVRAFLHQTGGLPVTISLFYTTGTLPSLGSNNSIVASLNADGSVNSFNNGTQPWVQIPNGNLGNATFTIPNVMNVFSDYPFSGWFDTTGGFTTATYFAIVIGTGVLTAANALVVQSISCVPGQIATPPAPMSFAASLLGCQRYYYKTFATATAPATRIGTNYLQWVSSVAGGGVANSPSFELPTEMRAAPTFTGYNPINNNAQAYDFGTTSDCNTTNVAGGTKNIIMFTTTPGGSASGHALGIQVTADARLGLV